MIIARIKVLEWAHTFAGYALSLIMLYLTNVWKLPTRHAAAIVNVYTGAKDILPIGMVFLLDCFKNYYRMLAISSLTYNIGLSLLAISTPPVLYKATHTCDEYKPECIGDTQQALFYTALVLIAFGLSGHTTAYQSFRKSIAEEGKSEVESCRRLLGRIAVLLISLTLAIGIGFIKPWSILYGIVAIYSIMATLLFLIGLWRYDRTRLQETEEEEQTQISARMIPVWITFIMCGVVSSVGSTYFMDQANNMNRKVGRIKVPLILFPVFQERTKSFFSSWNSLILYNKSNEKFTGRNAWIGIVLGMVLSVLCCIIAAVVENKRLAVIRSHGLLDKPDDTIPLSVFILLPQFILLGAVEGLATTSIKYFFSNEDSDSTKYLNKFSNGVFGAGVVGNVLMVYVLSKVSESGGKPSWFQDTLNRSRLNNYYWALAALSSVNLIAFLLVFCWYAST
ncbi:PTR2 domain-containing protein [Cephalotus follicularis]|uniref:PTR2 domain-containing protein n=1 Tax=Cephalotus follicularis TaxID=3775 RepID=A0A1Q3CWT4_CEPFO|nr:PTR2 domain-containing protein [Cephalotus follicularis]